MIEAICSFSLSIGHLNNKFLIKAEYFERDTAVPKFKSSDFAAKEA